ncbi:hypothetical protein GQ54DRAFT_12477 [Martensiomyces pterosporus]|nr:hypothetical protein GQ54DRAFT_12477 [Martensiomyces pterosporus]
MKAAVIKHDLALRSGRPRRKCVLHPPPGSQQALWKLSIRLRCSISLPICRAPELAKPKPTALVEHDSRIDDICPRGTQCRRLLARRHAGKLVIRVQRRQSLRRIATAAVTTALAQIQLRSLQQGSVILCTIICFKHILDLVCTDERTPVLLRPLLELGAHGDKVIRPFPVKTIHVPLCLVRRIIPQVGCNRVDHHQPHSAPLQQSRNLIVQGVEHGLHVLKLGNLNSAHKLINTHPPASTYAPCKRVDHRIQPADRKCAFC